MLIVSVALIELKSYPAASVSGFVCDRESMSDCVCVCVCVFVNGVCYFWGV